MGFIKAIIGARWFPYVLIGIVTAAGVTFGYGYMKGYNNAEAVYLTQMNKALERQLKEVLKQKDYELRLALQGERKKHAIQAKVDKVVRPSNSCELTPECLRWYDDVLSASSTDRP